VPVRLGDRLIGYLQTGQLFAAGRPRVSLTGAARLVAEWGVEVDREVLRRAYYSTKVVTAKQHESIVKLLVIFAQASGDAGQPDFHPAKERRAADHQARQGIHLRTPYRGAFALRAAKAVNMSTFYFCKMFKKVTEINFTDYLSRVRIEKAKNLLLNPNLRVSEIAFEVGFQSLTHFTVFSKSCWGSRPRNTARNCSPLSGTKSWAGISLPLAKLAKLVKSSTKVW